MAAAGSLRFLKGGLALLRWDKPSGRLILLIPAGWSLWLLPTSPPDPMLVALIGLGGLAVSGAGCVANDLWDRRIDPLVERTRLRPLASGAIGVTTALVLLLLALVLALGVVLALPAASRGLCLVLGLIYGHGYWQRPPDDGLSVDRHEARALYQAIADIVPADDLIIASHPTVIGLYAKRRSTNPSTHMSVDDFWHMAGQQNAKWLVANTPPLLDPLRPIQPALAERMKVAYENPAFTLYRLNQHQDQGHSPDGVDQKPSSSSF